MACNHPIPAYLSKEGGITFNRDEKILGPRAFIWIRCRMCIGCRADHARDWAARCYHEAQLHESNSFLTLTYRDDRLPPGNTLEIKDTQLFLKRLRKELYPKKIKFYCGAEYSKEDRPHYHMLIFGEDFRRDRYAWKKSDSGNIIYRSPTLEKLWTHGYIHIGEMSPASARYCAQYADKKIIGKFADSINPETGLRPYERLCPNTGEIIKVKSEFQHCSQGLGHGWLDLYWEEVYPSDQVVIEDRSFPPPEGYDHWLKKNHPHMWERVRNKRMDAAYNADVITGKRQHEVAHCHEYNHKTRMEKRT